MSTNNRDYIAAYNQLLKECDAVYHAAAACSGVSDCAFWILYAVQNAKEPYTQREICDQASLPKQTVNSALKKLEKDGYLVLERTGKKNSKSLHLTEQGSAFAQKYIVPVMKAEERACAAFSDGEKENFLMTFHTLVERLKEEITQVKPEEN